MDAAPNAEVEPNTEFPPKGLGFEVKFPKADFTAWVEDVVAVPNDVVVPLNGDDGRVGAGACSLCTGMPVAGVDVA